MLSSTARPVSAASASASVAFVKYVWLIEPVEPGEFAAEVVTVGVDPDRQGHEGAGLETAGRAVAPGPPSRAASRTG